MSEFLSIYSWALPVIIFCGRICDVSLSTLRIIFISRGAKKIAPIIGFCEVFIWIMIISQVLSQTNSVISYAAYAGGYATGTFVGLLIEEKIGYGFLAYRIFTMKNGANLISILHSKGFGATLQHGEGSTASVDVVETVIRRRHVKIVEDAVKDFDPDCFCVIEDVRAKQQGIFPVRARLLTQK